MRNTLKVTGMDITEDIRSYVSKKISTLDKLIDKNDTSALAQVEVGKGAHHKSGDVYMAEITLHVAGADFRAEFESSTVYAAIDGVRERMYQELQGYKRKKVSLLRRGGARIKDALRGIYRGRK